MCAETSGRRRREVLAHMMRALRGRNYKLYFYGQSVSVIGTWMQSVALGWLVYQMTDSKLMLGLVGFAGQIFSFLVSPFAGVLTDRWNRHRILVATQSLALVQAAVLAALTLAGVIQVWHIVLLATFLGLVMSVDIPNRQAFVVEMVDHREDLPNAIALNSLSFNAARLIGPVLAGVIVYFFGEGECFLLNAISYLAVIFTVLAMRLAPHSRPPARRIRDDLREGFVYCTGFPPILYTLASLGLLGLTVMPYGTLVPVFARDVLGGTSMTLGLLFASAGAGAIVGALFLANRRSVVGLGRFLSFNPVFLGAGLIGFGLSRTLWLSSPSLMVVGFCLMVQMAGSNTLIQTIVDDDKRGRVMSFYAIAFLGTVPFGNLMQGWLAEHIGAPWTVALGGGVCMVACVAVWPRLGMLRRHIRPLYVKLGILSEVAPIPQAAIEEDIEALPNGENGR